MSELHKEPINLKFYKAREKCSHRSYLLPLFNHLTSLKVDVDQFLLDRGCSQTGDLSSKLIYLRENAWHLFIEVLKLDTQKLQIVGTADSTSGPATCCASKEFVSTFRNICGRGTKVAR